MSGAYDYLVIVGDFWQNQAPVDLFDENPRPCLPMVTKQNVSISRFFHI